jgi:hypothetical protein
MRRHLATLCLFVLVATAGCVTPFSSGQLDADQLAEPAEYEWNTSANATIHITTSGTYQAVYTVTDSSFRVYQTDGLNRDRSVRVRSVRYRYPNGTVVPINASDTTVTQSETRITLPDDSGQLAYTGRMSAKRFRTPVLVNGSHAVLLPPNRDVSNPIFGTVKPSADTKTTVDGQVRLYWETVEADTIRVRYYLARDITLFTGLAVVAVILAIIAAAYVYLQIRQLRERRSELGLDIDLDDDDNDPPPGLR